ncbi:MAG: zinc ribbon domain-containing protein [Clostridia bacterium]|nr:zinc ribbon domain-containing protein [Clostridia bacterium]
MYCKNCGATIDDNAVFCSACGAKQTGGSSPSMNDEVRISCPVCPGQLFNNACVAYNATTGVELARCKQGELLIFKLNTPTQIKVVVKGSFGKPVETMSPGDKYKIGYRGLGKIYLTKVDTLI